MDDVRPQPSDPFAAPPRPPVTPVLPPAFRAQPSETTLATLQPVAEIAVTPAPPPRKKRSGLLAGVAVVAVLGAVVGVVLATRGDSEAGYSLKSAASAAAEADKVAFEMRMSAMDVEMTMTARVDTGAGLMAMTAELPTMEGGSKVDIVMDLGNQQMMMDASAFPMGTEVATQWVGIDLSKVPGAEDQFGSLTGTNPLDTARMFEAATNVEEVGIEDLNGESTKHFIVTVDVADAIAAQPGVFDQIGEAADALPDTIDYDVWVTEDDQLRKLAFSLEMLGQTIELEMNVTAIGDIEPIVVPSPDEVTDISDMLGG